MIILKVTCVKKSIREIVYVLDNGYNPRTNIKYIYVTTTLLRSKMIAEKHNYSFSYDGSGVRLRIYQGIFLISLFPFGKQEAIYKRPEDFLNDNKCNKK
jgi:hypothetical protein